MHLLEYGVQATVTFPLIDYGATDFESTPVTFASGDCKITKDGGTLANTSNLPSHVGNGIYKLTLETSELQAKNVGVVIIDQSVTKEWEDQYLYVQTCNHASAQLPQVGELGASDLPSEPPTAASIAQEIMRRDIDLDENSAPVHSLTNVILHFASKFDATSGEVYKTDGTTVFATRTPTTDAGADPITTLGVAS